MGRLDLIHKYVEFVMTLTLGQLHYMKLWNLVLIDKEN